MTSDVPGVKGHQGTGALFPPLLGTRASRPVDLLYLPIVLALPRPRAGPTRGPEDSGVRPEMYLLRGQIGSEVPSVLWAFSPDTRVVWAPESRPACRWHWAVRG